jgi:L-alanine-DL-glutamate epimerase-like enolase superfamily enzyme
MIDVNGKWSLETASKLARELDAYDLFWCEEPLHFDDLVSHAKLAKRMNTPMASSCIRTFISKRFSIPGP